MSTVTQLADRLRSSSPNWTHHVFADGSVVSVRRGTAGRPATLSTGPGWSPMNQQIAPLSGTWTLTTDTQTTTLAAPTTVVTVGSSA
jgi:hypothetical protein